MATASWSSCKGWGCSAGSALPSSSCWSSCSIPSQLFQPALEICDLDLLSARRETHCLNFARSLLKSERTKMLIPPADRRFMANSLEIAPTSPNYVHTLTDSLKAPYPTTLACLIPPSVPSWWLLCCPHLWCGFWISLPFASAYFLLLIVLFLCLFVWRNSALGLRCYAIKIISYHISCSSLSWTASYETYAVESGCVVKPISFWVHT